MTLTVLSVCFPLSASDFVRTDNGVKAEIGDMKMSVTFYTPATVRIEKQSGDSRKPAESYSVISTPDKVRLTSGESSGRFVLKSDRIRIEIDKSTGLVSFYTDKGRLLTAEKDPAEFRPVSYSGQPTLAVEQSFSIDSDEAVYGLGNLEHGNLSQRGLTRALFPSNIEDGIPLMQTSKGYGIFWDNYSSTTFSDKGDRFLFFSEIGPDIDYYFMYGGDSDGVIA